MNNQINSSFWKRNIWDILLTTIFSLGAIALFITEINVAKLSQLNDALFGSLEFLLSIAAGFFLQRIASREAFQKSLKQFALSAYRRITDIRKSITRLHDEIIRMRTTHPKDTVHELDVLAILTDEVRNTVNSSVYDWADIIGEEIKKAERLEELESWISVSSIQNGNSDETIKRIDEIQSEIDSLRSDLPLFLEMAAKSQKETFPRGGRHSPTVYKHFMHSIESEGHIILRVRPMIDNKERIENGSPYKIIQDSGMSKQRVAIHDKEGEWIGEVLNPFDESDVYRNDFTVTLFEILNPFFPGSTEKAPPRIELIGSEFAGYTDNKKEFFVKVNLPEE